MYVPRMEYVDFTGEIVLQQMNRLQNTNDVWLADPATGKARKMLHDEDKAWLDVVDSWQWLPSKELLWVSEGHGWRHAYAAPRDGANWRLLTPGEFDIETVEGVDEKGEFLYFIASPDDATRRYLYRARLDGRGTPQRVTPANQPGTHSYKISPDGRYAVHTVSTIDRPPVTDLVQLPEHKSLRVLEDNKELAAAAAPVLTPATEFFRVDIGGGVQLDGWMVKPKNFDPSKKYPLLMYVYGEPAGVEVTDKWRGDPSYRMLFHRALADAGYVVACVDNRGTPSLKGREWRKIIYGEVGVLATADQTAAVRAHARVAAVPRSRARRLVGMERRRLDDAEPPLPLTRPLQGRHVRGARARPDALRHDLPGALHGPARTRTPRATGRARPSFSPKACAASSSSCTAPATTTCTTRAPSGSSTGSSFSASRSTSWCTRTARMRSTRARAPRTTCTRSSRAICGRTCGPGRSDRAGGRRRRSGHPEERSAEGSRNRQRRRRVCPSDSLSARGSTRDAALARPSSAAAGSQRASSRSACACRPEPGRAGVGESRRTSSSARART